MSLLTSDYISSWYLAKERDDGKYYLLQNITNSTTYDADAKDLIQGEAGVLVIDSNSQREVTTVSSEVLILKNSSGENNVDTLDRQYRDIIDLLLYDYKKLMSFFFLSLEDTFVKKYQNILNIVLSELKLVPNNKNLLSNAVITIGDSINCTLTYQTKYTNKFDIIYASNLDGTAEDFDFIARTAKNFDCRFFIDGNEYKILSGNVNINIGYKEIFLANSYYRLPFYSPQKNSVDGEIEILAKHNEYGFIAEEGNCSLLIGDRYIELGQASVKTSYSRSLNSSQSPTSIKVNFKAYARLGANVDDRWLKYYVDFISQLTNSNLPWDKVLDELKKLLRGFN